MDKNRLLGESSPRRETLGAGVIPGPVYYRPLRDCLQGLRSAASGGGLLSTAACPLLIFGEAFVHLRFTIPLELTCPPR